MKNFQVEVTEKQVITNTPEILSRMFPKGSPIPGFVFFSIKPRTEIYLKTAVFSLEIFNETFCEKAHKDNNLIATKRQTIFVLKNDGKSFQYAFTQDNIGITLKKGLRDHTNINCIVLVTKYFWQKIDDPLEEIVEQDVSVLVLKIPPEQKLEVQQYLETV